MLFAGLLFNACTDSPVSSVENSKTEITALALGDNLAATQTQNVFISNNTVDTWDPIPFEDVNWQVNKCVSVPEVGLDGVDGFGWTGPSPRKATQFPKNTAAFERWFVDFDAYWINAWDNIWANQFPNNTGNNDKTWSKYSTTVKGEAGEYVLQFIADNCSWIYLDDTLVGSQLSTSGDGKFLVSLPGGEVELSFIILDGGGEAGGIFRLETRSSFEDGGGDTGGIPEGESPEPTNQAPVANAGADQTLEAAGSTTSVTLDGSGSTDPDGDTLTYSWSNGGTSVSTTVNLGVGSHTFTLTVTDENGASDSDDVTITIEDTTAPVLSFNQVTGSLWPPNHKMVLVATGISAHDLVDGAPDVTVIVSSNEAANGRGDGNTDSDYEIVTRNDGSIDVYVRAERSGRGNGRVYTISMSSSDVAGNSASESFEVQVAQNQGRGRGR